MDRRYTLNNRLHLKLGIRQLWAEQALWVNQRSQINEDTVEPLLAAQDINPIAYAPDLIFAPRAGFVPGSVQLIRPVRVGYLA